MKDRIVRIQISVTFKPWNIPDMLNQMTEFISLADFEYFAERNGYKINVTTVSDWSNDYPTVKSQYYDNRPAAFATIDKEGLKFDIYGIENTSGSLHTVLHDTYDITIDGKHYAAEDEPECPAAPIWALKAE